MMRTNILKKKIKNHKPLLLEESINAFTKGKAHLNDKKIIDATLGSAGHTIQFVQIGADVLGIEADRKMLEIAQNKLETACPVSNNDIRGSYRIVNGNFRNILQIAKENQFEGVDGILFDLGVSTIQLTDIKRGFSFSNKDTPLDMRINPETQNVKAFDLLNVLHKPSLVALFSDVLGRGESLKFSQKIIDARKLKDFLHVGDLLDIIDQKYTKKKSLHPATKVFMALRIAVNSEMQNLKEALPQALNLLSDGGRICVISFHSLEDRIVKHFFKQKQKEGIGFVVNKKPVTPSSREIINNKRSRSAKLRIFEKK